MQCRLKAHNATHLEFSQVSDDKGGEIIAEGIPEDVAKNPTSHTAKYLKKVLK